MKKQILKIGTVALFTIGSIAFIGCGNSHEANETAEQEAIEQEGEAVYACPMHPEITGKEGDSCSECGMELQEVE